MSDPASTNPATDWLRQDRLDVIWWGSVLIWGAMILLADNAGWADNWSWWDGWAVFFTGAGALSLLGAVIRLRVPEYRPKWQASLIFGAIFMAIGLGSWDAAGWIWVVVLAVVGVTTLLSAFPTRS